MKEKKKRADRTGQRLKGSAPIAGQNRTDPETSATDPMGDPLELRMRREGHDM